MIKFIKLLLSSIFAALAIPIVAKAHININDSVLIPLDSMITIGHLDNGLTYYIRHNNWPEQRACFYLVQKVGSMQEEDSQRGLAHFLEHMCFNGSEHFAGNGIQKFCEGLGVSYGNELNAYTSHEETVYNIDNVPTTVGQARLDSCLLVLADWSHGLLLDTAEIRKERGVIHEEWRQRREASDRIFERMLPQMYPGSRYAYRMPIGVMSVVDNFDPRELRAYYDKWYNPENQCVIVVGDIDVKHIEQKIHELFGGLGKDVPDSERGIITPTEVIDHKGAVVYLDKDKELDANNITVWFKHDADTRDSYRYMLHEKLRYLRQAALTILNERFSDEALKEECPFISASSDYGDYLFATTKAAFTLSADIREGKEADALKMMIFIARQAATFGFTETEFERFKIERLSHIDQAMLSVDKIEGGAFVNRCQGHYLRGYGLMSEMDRLNTHRTILEAMTLEDVNSVMCKMFTESDDNMFLSVWDVEKEGREYPTESELREALNSGRSMDISPYVDKVADMDIIKELPICGSIISETENSTLGYKQLTLSNGIQVILKHTDFDKSEVRMSAWGKGGWSQFGMDYQPTVNAFGKISYGLNNMSTSQIEKYLSGKQVSWKTGLRQRFFDITGKTTPKDMETLLKIVHATFTCPTKDDDDFRITIQSGIEYLENIKDNAETAFYDSILVVDNAHSPYYSPSTAETLRKVDYDKALEMLRLLTSEPSGYTFVFVGNYDEETIRPLLEQYLASIPKRGSMELLPFIDTYPKKDEICHFKHRMETPKTQVQMTWRTEAIPYSLENNIIAIIVSDMMNIILDRKVREETTMTYDCSMSYTNTTVTGDDRSYCSFYVDCTMKPEGRDKLISIIKDEFVTFVDHIDPTMLRNVKDNNIKYYEEAEKSNGYWIRVLTKIVKDNLDMHSGIKNVIEGITPEKISAYLKTFFSNVTYSEVLMEAE